MSYNAQETPKGHRIDIGGEYKAKDHMEAAKKFAKELIANGYGWVAEAMEESIENGYYYDSNASEIDLVRGADPIPAKSSDWTYYWGVLDLGDGMYYAWLIDFPEA